MRKFNGKSNISGSIIEKYRKLKNMSREDLAEKLQLLGLNIDRFSIYRIEKNEIILKDFELICICKILKIDYHELENELEKKESSFWTPFLLWIF